MTMSPCVFPRCKDVDGNPRLTADVICDPCRSHYRHLLDWIVLDYLALRQFPSPARREGDGSAHQSPKAKSFGHPAEWASDTMREIGQSLNWAEDGLREHVGHEVGIHPYARESLLVKHGYRYLTAQFEALCTYDAAEDTAIELSDLHHKIRRALGQTRSVQRLPTPCPWCDVAALTRTVERIECLDCGKMIEPKHYGWFVNWHLDRIIEEHDAKAEGAAEMSNA